LSNLFAFLKHKGNSERSQMTYRYYEHRHLTAAPSLSCTAQHIS